MANDELDGAPERPDPFERATDKFLQSQQKLTSVIKRFSDDALLSRDLLVQLLKPVPQDLVAKFQSNIKTATDLMEARMQQLPLDITFLCEMGVTSMWANVEELVDDLCVALLTTTDLWKTSKKIRDLKGNLVPFALWSHEHQVRHLLELMKVQIGGSRTPGVVGFDRMFEALGISGSISASARKTLIRFAETRHLLVHRGGVIDKKFVERCPWRGATEGERIEISIGDFSCFKNAAVLYLVSLTDRIAARGFGSEAFAGVRNVAALAEAQVRGCDGSNEDGKQLTQHR